MGRCSIILDLLTCMFLTLHKGISVYSQGDGHIPNFNVPAVNITSVSGRTAVLTCTIDSIGDHMVAWMDPKLKLLTMNDKRIIEDTRISVERPFTKDWNLHIRHVRMNDSGEYLCQINTSPVKSMKILLIVSEPPTILEHAGDKIVREGDNVSLYCKVHGEPYPKVTWYRKHEQQTPKEVLGSDGEALMIYNISRYCEDVYECVANNNIEPRVSQHMKVTVQFPPEVELYTNRLSQTKGLETILLCKITANPHAYSVWKYDKKPLQNTAKYGITVYEDDRYTKTLALRIGHLDDQDFGKYKCYAENNFGNDEQSMVLTELVERRRPTTTTTEKSSLIINDYEKRKHHKHTTPRHYNPYYPYPDDANRPDYRKGSLDASRGKAVSIVANHILITACALTVVMSARSALHSR